MDDNIYTPPQTDPLAATDTDNTSGMGKGHPIPDGVKGWSWGAFFLNWIWAIGNKTWIGLIALIPYLGFVMVIILGIKGREWAWRNKQWESVEHFQKVQRRWSIWGSVITLLMLAFIFLSVAIPAYQEYVTRAGGG